MADATTMAPTVVEDLLTNDTHLNGTLRFTPQESMMAYSGLYSMALFCIFMGARRSVEFVKKSIMDKEPIENSITTKEARMFPFTASGVLFGLYCFFKFGDRIGEGKRYAISFIHNSTGLLGRFIPVEGVDATNATVEAANRAGIYTALNYLPTPNKENLMFLLLLLICLEGCVALSQLMKPFVTRVLRMLPFSEDGELKQNLQYQLRFNRTKKRDSKETTDLMSADFDTHDIVSLLIFGMVGVSHVCCRHWITNDIIGVAFSLYGIEKLHLASFKDGCMLLAGLFVYDIFWVFATDVMTTVATGINAPILLMFPQDMLRVGAMAAKKHSMLGLGDIVIPGIFLALLLRFDQRIDQTQPGKKQTAMKGSSRNYFAVTMVAYAAGLVLTIAVMHWFKAAQPALLYLVPLCIGAPVLWSLIMGEFSELWNYTEIQFVKKDDEKEAEKKTQ